MHARLHGCVGWMRTRDFSSRCFKFLETEWAAFWSGWTEIGAGAFQPLAPRPLPTPSSCGAPDPAPCTALQVTDALTRGYQAMVFVHSRKDTGKTGRTLAVKAQGYGETALFDCR